MKENVIELLYRYRHSFATHKEPLGSISGYEVDIILKIQRPYPPLLRRQAYPARPRARESLEVHIQELIDIGVLKKVGHNEKVEVTKLAIIAWQNGN
ncbi:hypothetical protein O181_054171 [Austropuccinia psidii MF-1]|uniref:Uncharacterized protein n=1 Tax=Austropuccinia psidii MF-1 TaxID=1389203 RepID=A0A9Q3E201_9BASI|nr:hypothetical protein [Austropuccinia psidii MF-1]